MALLFSSALMMRPGILMVSQKKHSSSRKRWAVSASIGFSTDPRIQIEKAAGGLLKDVAALLVYQEVFRCPPAQAFLKLLLVLRRRDDDLKIFEAYGEFVRLMAFGHHPSWEDFLLEGILKAEGNAFAEAAAGLGDSSSSYGGEIPPSLEAAAVADLESLQRLSINESTLASWVAELVSETNSEWRSAASSNLSCRTVSKVSSSNDQKPSFIGFALTDTEVEKKDLEETTQEAEQKSERRVICKETDFVISGREQWQKKIGGLWKWSEAVPSLKQYYTEYGFGRAAVSQAVKWKAGKLTPDFKYLKAVADLDLTVLKNEQSELRKNLKSFVSRSFAPRNVFLHGPHGSGKSWVLRSALSKLAEEARFRVLILPSTEVKQLVSLLEELRKSSAVSFVLVIEDLFLRAAEESFLLLKATMDEHFQEWPANVLLCATSSRSEAKVGDASVKLGNIFGLSLCLRNLDNEQYLRCVEEMLSYKVEKLQLNSTINKEEVEHKAVEWGQQTALDVRSAARFVDVMTRDLTGVWSLP